MNKINETELYEPIRDYLIEQNYTVNSEVLNCDITAIKDKELIIIELKTSLNLTLILQAVNRQKSADSVYIAIPTPNNRRYPKNWKNILHLLKRLELGLIIVTFLKSKKRVDIVLHPCDYVKRKSHKTRFNIIKEINGRTIDKNVGGSVKKKLMTAYRENAIFIACCLNKFGSLSPKQLREIGTGEKTQNILSKNFYGWFERIEKGLYKLNSNGKLEIKNYPDIIKHYKNLLKKIKI